MIKGSRKLVDEVYSKGIYRKMDNLLIRLHNIIPFTLFDILVASGISSIMEIYTASGATKITDFLSDPSYSSDEVSRFVYLPFFLAGYCAVNALTYMANRARSPLEDTLELDKKQGELDMDFLRWVHDSCVDITQQIRSEPIKEPEFSVYRARDVIRSELERMEGRAPGVFPRPKRWSIVPKVIGFLGAGAGYLNISPEICVSKSGKDEQFHAVAHEFVHSKGYVREAEVEFITYQAEMNYGDRDLIIYALRRRRALCKAFCFENRNKLEGLLESDIGDGDMKILTSLTNFRKKDSDSKEIFRSKIRQGLARILTGNRGSDYTEGFLRLLYAYELKHGETY